jgi:protein gp37
MSSESSIGWTANTQNWWTGCVPKSPGCRDCYAKAWMKRTSKTRDFGDVRKSTTWGDPPKWQRRLEESGGVELVFTCSLSDFLIDKADEWRQEAWDIMRQCDRLIWQILTKEIERWPQCLPADWSDWGSSDAILMENCWPGCSAENQEWYDKRIPLLAAWIGKRFPVAMLSLEPLIGPINLDLDVWASMFNELFVITGAESGGTRRPFDTDWALDIAAQCDAVDNVTFFFKQGSHFKPDQPCGLPALDDRKEWPPHLQRYAAGMSRPPEVFAEPIHTPKGIR